MGAAFSRLLKTGISLTSKQSDMRICYVSSFDPKRVGSWSGTGYYLSQALKQSEASVEYIAPLPERYEYAAKARQLYYRTIRNQKHLRAFDPMIVRGYAKTISEQIEKLKPDVVFSVWSIPIAFLETDIPICFTSDAVFSLMKDFYPDWSNVSERSKVNGDLVDSHALSRAQAAIYCSDWAANAAIDHYSAKKSRIHVIPYGANIAEENIPSKEQVIRKDAGNTCSLLFLGVDWKRKGGDIAYNAMLRLRSMGIPASLTICGCIPDDSAANDPNVTVIPFLDKSKPNDLNIFSKLLSTSTFLLLPTRAEAFGIVFCEAAAFGLPSISTDVGGVSTAVHDGINGRLLPLSAQANDYAEMIAEIWNSPTQYAELSNAARERYDSELNWNKAAERILNVLKSIRK